MQSTTRRCLNESSMSSCGVVIYDQNGVFLMGINLRLFPSEECDSEGKTEGLGAHRQRQKAM